MKLDEITKVHLSKDPNNLGADVDEVGELEPTVMIPIAQIRYVFEPDDLHQTKPGAPQKIKRMVKAIRDGKQMPPILVRKHKDGYQVLDGHHRFKAYRITKAEEVPARIIDPENITGDVDEAWSNKYKRGIDCSHPKGFSQKAHCAARRKRAHGGKTKSKPIRESFDPIRYVKQARAAIAIGWIDNVIDRMTYGVSVGKVTPADPIRELLEENKDLVIKHLLVAMKRQELNDAGKTVSMLRKMGIKWTELSAIEKSLAADLKENFADGNGPGRPGDSRRHGIPKNATLSQLDKIGKGSGRKAQLARWQANMRRGRAKVNETIAPHGDFENELKMMKAGTKPAVLTFDAVFDELYRPIAKSMGWEIVKFSTGKNTHYVVAQKGQKARAERIARIVADANKQWGTGQKVGPEYHRELGTLLGYSKADVDHFISNTYGKEEVTEADPTKVGHDAALTVFDIDETLFHTKAKVLVVKDGKVTKELDNRQFNTYILEPGESFDFTQFTDARFFQDTSVPIEKMWDKAKNILDKVGRRPGSQVIIVTARSDFDDKETFLDTFRKHGLDIDKVHVHRAGNLNLPSAQAKKIIIKKYLDSGRFDMVRLFDDAESNLRGFLSLRDDFPDITFKAYMVFEDGSVREYRI